MKDQITSYSTNQFLNPTAITVTAPDAHPHKITERGGRPTAIAKAGADYFSELKRYVELDPPAEWHPQLTPAARAIIEAPELISDEELASGVAEGDKLITGANVQGSVKKMAGAPAVMRQDLARIF